MFRCVALILAALASGANAGTLSDSVAVTVDRVRPYKGQRGMIATVAIRNSGQSPIVFGGVSCAVLDKDGRGVDETSFPISNLKPGEKAFHNAMFFDFRFSPALQVECSVRHAR